MITYSVELPVAAQIVRAGHPEPFLALKLDPKCRPVCDQVVIAPKFGFTFQD